MEAHVRGFFSWIIIFYTLIFSLRSFATVGPRLLESLSSAQAQAIEKSLAKKVAKQLKVKHLKDFKILWNDKINQCIDLASEMQPDAEIGVCTISFSAFQTSGTAALIRGLNGNSTSIIQLDVE